MKFIIHLLIITLLVILTFVLYDDGLGAIPFLLAAFYFGCIGIKEFRQFKKGKRL